MLILALALSLAMALLVLAADESLRERLGPTYWTLSLAIIGSILLVLAGYAWDRTLMERLRAIHEVTRQSGGLSSAGTGGSDFPAPAEGDEISGLARQIERMAWTIQRTESRYRDIVEVQDDLICRYRPDGTLTFVNGAFARHVGRSTQELIGQPLPLLQAGRADLEAQRFFQPAASFEIEWPRNGGTPVRFLWKHRQLPSAVDESAEIQAIARDLTDQQEARATLVRARDAAERAERAKREFLAVTSHELRTPINGVLGFARLLRETPLTPDQREYVELIADSGAALDALVSDILDLSGLEAGRLELEQRSFSLRDCVQEVIDRLEPLARKAGLALETRLDPEVPLLVNGDGSRLRQVLMNLVNNAIKFTPRGRVTVSLTCMRSEDIVGTDRRRLRLFGAVADTGIGIAPEHLPQLFRPFQQIDASSTRRRGGTGLGLVIAKRLCELMGGALSVESRVGEGSTFRFSVALDYQRGDSMPPMMLVRS